MITRRWMGVLLSSAIVFGAACADRPTEASLEAATTAALTAALNSTPAGYGDLSSSYVGTTSIGFSEAAFFLGGGKDAWFGRGTMMGGGMGEEFNGGMAFGRGGFGHDGPFGGGLRCSGVFNATTGRVECPAETHNGLVTTLSASYATAAGATQQAFDSVTTNTVNIQSKVVGTVTYDTTSGGRGPDGRRGWGNGRGPGGRLLGDTTTILSASTIIASNSTRTTTGLAKGSTARTVNGASGGTEATTGKSGRGNFTSSRVVGDTTKNLVVPVITTTTTMPYPTGGSVIREMKITMTYAGATPITVSRREVVTYNGLATATIVVTENGVPKTCTRALPRGPLMCP